MTGDVSSAHPSPLDAPGRSAALVRFLASSPCPFARRAEIKALAPWSDRSIDGEKLDHLHDGLLEMLSEKRFDLAVLGVRDPGSATAVPTWAGWLHGVLFGLRQRDRTIAEPLTTGISEPEWDFRFDRGSFFLSLFAPVYPASHSRWSVEEDVAFLLMQPERGFRRFGVSSKRPERGRLSERVHQGFARKGQHYDLSINLEPAKALRYIKPLEDSDPPIAWWQHSYGAAASPFMGSEEPL
jgi:hypothetical protein